MVKLLSIKLLFSVYFISTFFSSTCFSIEKSFFRPFVGIVRLSSHKALYYPYNYNKSLIRFTHNDSVDDDHRRKSLIENIDKFLGNHNTEVHTSNPSESRINENIAKNIREKLKDKSARGLDKDTETLLDSYSCKPPTHTHSSEVFKFASEANMILSGISSK